MHWQTRSRGMFTGLHAAVIQCHTLTRSLPSMDNRICYSSSSSKGGDKQFDKIIINEYIIIFDLKNVSLFLLKETEKIFLYKHF